MNLCQDMYHFIRDEKTRTKYRMNHEKIKTNYKAAGESFVTRSNSVHVKKNIDKTEFTDNNKKLAELVRSKSMYEKREGIIDEKNSCRRNGISEISDAERYGLNVVLKEHIQKVRLKQFGII